MLSLVIPVYNEGENIAAALSEIKQKVKTPHETLVVYDFDEDNTLPVVKKHSEIKLVKNKYGAGVLNAIKTGFESVPEGVVLVVMADLADDLGAVDLMFEKIKAGADIVCGSRYMKDGQQIGGPLLKRTMSRLAGVSLYYLAGIPTHDVTNSFKMYTKKLLNQIKIESNGGFELGMEIVVKAFAQGFRIEEVPSIWHDRTSGTSRFKLWQWLPKYLHWYFYALRHKK